MSYTEENYRNFADCYTKCAGDVSQARKLCYSRYGIIPSPETFELAIKCVAEGIFPEVVKVNDIENEGDTEEVMAETIIKEEIKEEVETVSVSLLPNVLSNSPIVYTTRLDDMLIFNKNFERLDVADVIENILHESKPKFRRYTLQRPEKTPVISPFYKLIRNIIKLNQMTIKSTIDFHEENTSFSLNERSKTLLSKCVPLRICLQDCKIKRGCTVIVRTDSDGNVTTSLKSDRIHYSARHNKSSIRKRAKLRRGEYNYIVFNNLGNKTTDVYFINKKTCTSIYVSLDHLAEQDEVPFNSVNLQSCCWHARENSISNIIGWPNKYKKIAKFMRKPHVCPLGRCLCCCKSPHNKYYFRDVIPVTSEKIAGSVRKSALFVNEKPVWLKILQSHPRFDGSDNYVNRALRYATRKQENDWIPARLNIVDPGYFQFNINNVSKNEVESYYVAKNGTVVKHIAVKYAADVDQKDSNEACCWVKRNWLVCKSNSTLQARQFHTVKCYMKIPHTCPADICVCCCKNKSLEYKRPLKISSQISYPKYAKSYSNKTFKCLKMIKKNSKKVKVMPKPTQLPLALVLPSIAPLQPLESSTSLPSTLTTSLAHTPVSAFPSSHQATTSVPTSLARLSGFPKKQASTQTAKRGQCKKLLGKQPNPLQNATNPDIKHNLMEKSSQLNANMSGVPIDAENQDPTVNSLVQSILNRFKDVKLTMTPDGDISAELNTPIENLSTAELKILSAILAHAKEQVKALKSHPSVNHVNLNPLGPSISGLIPDPRLSNISIPNAPMPNLVYFPVGAPTNVNTSVPTPSNPPTMKPLILHTPVAKPLNGPVMMVNPIIRNKSIPSYVYTENRSNSESPVEGMSNSAANSRVNDTSKSFSSVRKQGFFKDNAYKYECYTNISGLKMKQYIESCKSFLISKEQESCVPKISNVFQLNTLGENVTENLQSAQAAPKPGPSGIKRKVSKGINQNDEEKPKRSTPRSVENKLPTPINQEQPSIIADPAGEIPAPDLPPALRPVDNPAIYAPILSNLINSPLVPPFSNKNVDSKLLISPTTEEVIPYAGPVVGPAYSLAKTDSDMEIDSDSNNVIVISKIEISEDCILGV